MSTTVRLSIGGVPVQASTAVDEPAGTPATTTPAAGTPAAGTPGTKTRKVEPEAVAAAVATKDMTPKEIGRERVRLYQEGLATPTPTEQDPVLRGLHPERAVEERREFYEGRVGPSGREVAIQTRAPLTDVGKLRIGLGEGVGPTAFLPAGTVLPSSERLAPNRPGAPPREQTSAWTVTPAGKPSLGVARFPLGEAEISREATKARIYADPPPLARPRHIDEDFIVPTGPMTEGGFADFGQLQQEYAHMSIPLLEKYQAALDAKMREYMQEMATAYTALQSDYLSTGSGPRREAYAAQLSILRDEVTRLTASSNQATQTRAHLQKVEEALGFDVELAEEAQSVDAVEKEARKEARKATFVEPPSDTQARTRSSQEPKAETYSSQQVTESTSQIREAVEGLGTDGSAILSALSGDPERLRAIARAYRDSYGESLVQRIRDEQSGDILPGGPLNESLSLLYEAGVRGG